MSDFYQPLDRPHFDYQFWPVPELEGRRHRGPPLDLARPYLACVGAAQTFGRFSHRPFPALLGELLGLPALNLGVGGTGPRHFDLPAYRACLNRAELVVVQLFSGRSEGNSQFDNRATGSLIGRRVGDGAELRFEDILEALFRERRIETIRALVRETQENYLASMTKLLQGIHRPTLLLWFSIRRPPEADNFHSTWALLGDFPHLVTRAMVERLRGHAQAYVEFVSREGLPQRLWPADAAVDGTTLVEGWLENRYYPSPEMHRAAAALLAGACRGLRQVASPP